MNADYLIKNGKKSLLFCKKTFKTKNKKEQDTKIQCNILN